MIRKEFSVLNTRTKEFCELISKTINAQTKPEEVNEKLSMLTSSIEIDTIDVQDRVVISNHVLKILTREQRMQLAKCLI